MNKRASDILFSVVYSNYPLSITVLANRFEISERSIRNDINTINDFLKENHIPEIKIRNGFLVKPKEDIPDYKLNMKIVDRGYFFSKEERGILLAIELLSSTDYITVNQLMEVVNSSRSTVLQDLKSVRELMEENHIEILSQTGKGLRTTGTEADKRKSGLKLILKGFNSIEYMCVSNTFQAVLLRQIDKLDIYNKCEEIIKISEKRTEIQLSDYAYYRTLYYLLFIIPRIKCKNYIEPGDSDDGVDERLARYILEYLSRECGIRVPEEEIRLLGKVISGRLYFTSSDVNGADTRQVQAMAKMIVERACGLLEIDAWKDESLYENLEDALSGNIEYTNEHSGEREEELIKYYPSVSEALDVCIEQVKHDFLIEIPVKAVTTIKLLFCATYERYQTRMKIPRIVVACASGVATAQLLEERLKSLFRVEIIGRTSIHGLEQFLDVDFDFIVSSVPIQNAFKPYITVSPVIGKKDYMSIQAMISGKSENN